MIFSTAVSANFLAATGPQKHTLERTINRPATHSGRIPANTKNHIAVASYGTTEK
jgi:hypothetical protein